MSRDAKGEWEILRKDERRTGTYFALNIAPKGEKSYVTVKARTGPGRPYVCLTCNANECPHIAFVRARDTEIDQRDLPPAPIVCEGDGSMTEAEQRHNTKPIVSPEVQP